MNTPVITRAERIWPVGTNPSTDRLKNSPSVTKLTDMNEYRKASNFDHPLTSPVALRRNSVGASPATAIRVPFQPQPASAAGAISMNALLRAEPSPHGGSAGGLGPPHLAVDQLIGPDLPLPGVEVHDRRLKNPFLVGAARVERERAADPGRAPALVDMAVQGEQRLEAPDRLAHRRGADRAQRLPAGDVAQVGVERWRVVELGAVRRGVEVEDRGRRVARVGERPLDPARQLRLLCLAERVPRRGVGPPHRDHREVAELDGMVLVPGLDDQ